MEKNGKPSLIEQRHNAQQAWMRAKKRGDKAEAEREAAFIYWINNEIKKGKV